MLRRLASLFWKRKLDAELDAEVRCHLQMLEDEFRASGMSAEEARFAARREFGPVEPMKETYRDRRGVPWLSDFVQDVRYAARGLRRNPGFAAAAILSLALGVGLNTAVFSIFHALLLRSLPVERPDELVSLYRLGAWGEGYMSFPLYSHLRDQKEVFAGVLARSGVSKARLRARAAAVQILQREYVSGNYFDVLGVRAVLGRTLTPEDSRTPGKNPVAVLSYEAWRDRFALDATVLGRSIVLDDKPLTVVGIVQPSFSGVELGEHTEAWVPLTMSGTDLNEPGMHWLWAIARRRAGVPDAKIQAVANTIVARYVANHYSRSPESGFKRMAMGQRIEVRPGGAGLSMLRQQFGEPLRILMGAVVLVLLIACANVAGLMLARGAARRRETALRLSIGASRFRLVRQSLAEAGLVAAIGGACGLLVAIWAARGAIAILPGAAEGNSIAIEAGGPVLLWAAAIATCGALLFGVAAGLGATTVDTATALKESSSGAQGSRLRVGLRRGIIVAQVALSLVLAVSAVLFARSLAGLRSRDLGFRTAGVFTFYVDLPESIDVPARGRIEDRVMDRVQNLPGVISASAGFPGPYRGGMSSGDVFVPGYQKNVEKASVDRQSVYPRYFETLGAPPLRGRDFETRDRLKGSKVAIVNEAFVREFFGGADPVGRSIGLNRDGRADVTIVGLVRDMRHDGIRSTPAPVVYLPHEAGQYGPLFAIRSAMPPGDLENIVRRVVAEIAPEGAPTGMRTLAQRVDNSILRERLLAGLSITFGVLALALAAIGLYGLMAYLVAMRTAEIGVRAALGALPSTILRDVLAEGLRIVAVGLAIGLPAALAAVRLARGLLFGIKPTDPVSIVLAVAVLVVIGVAATGIPARRAAALDPVQALRAE